MMNNNREYDKPRQVSAMVSAGCTQEIKGLYTFHVSFAFEHDECIPSAATLLVAYYSDTFYASEAFEFATKVILRGTFVLKCCKSELKNTYTAKNLPGGI